MKVLRRLGEDCNIDRYIDFSNEEDIPEEIRKWLLVVCDGLPFHLLVNILYDCVICSHCNKPFMTREKLLAHYRENHEAEFQSDVISFEREFDWVLPRCGLGHYYMNQLKCFFDVNWEPCLKAMCYTMGFQSDVALKSAKRCANTHKAWALLCIFFFSTLKELLVPYVKHCRAEGLSPNVDHYVRLVDDLQYRDEKNETYEYYFETTLRFSLAIINMMMGTRRNNARLVWSSKHKFKELIHARNHPKYQVIDMIDFLYHEQAPPAVRKFLERNTSVSTSGHPSLGEDIDFILEEENRRCKKMLPPGVPLDKQWETVCRNVNDLYAIRESHHKMIGMEAQNMSMCKKCVIDLLFCKLLVFYHYLQNKTLKKIHL